ncbi:MAG: 2-oxoacid:acceptor oxidoreductase subunit alpha [Candidatus Zixiibacteriota bacterium]|nr:MAG: 2-oxoacid:acceptor oxidoreductase subunit alpha [candidate division Zixibacteria bacterium]
MNVSTATSAKCFALILPYFACGSRKVRRRYQLKASSDNVLTGSHYLDGNHAAAEGAIAAGCKFFAGYPITPSTEIAERVSRRFPLIGGIFIQMEDELASMGAILGASWGGVKSMSCTSGPGFSLMMENFGLGIMLETPCVLVNVQRGGPSTGLPTLPGQADMMQARWGSHGDYEVIALAPVSPQESFELAIHAFNLSEKYRMPILIMTDECVGHMTEKVVIPPPEEIELVERRYTDKPAGKAWPFELTDDLISPMLPVGKGYKFHITGLTHDERGYPIINAEAQEKNVRRLIDKVNKHVDEIIWIEEKDVEDADIVIMAYGISARVMQPAITKARKEGIKVGQIKMVTVWPFPEKRVRELADKVKALIMVEMNYGQVFLELDRCAAGKCRTYLAGHAGGTVHDPENIYNTIKEAAK